MLKKKLKDGTVVGLSMESVQGGVLLTLDEQPTNPKAQRQKSFILNPGEVSEFIDGLRKQYCHIRAKDGRKLEFRSPQVWEHKPIYISITSELVDCSRIIFPLHEHEIYFIRKALEHMAASLLFVGTWSGEPEEW